MKFINLLALSLLLSACAKKHSYQSIYSAGDTYCAITSNGTKCFRFTQDQKNNPSNQSFSPMFLDEIGLPQLYEKKVFSDIKMDFSSGDRVTRVCGYDDLKEPSCWEYEADRALVKPIELSVEEKTAYRLGSFGVVKNSYDLSKPVSRVTQFKHNFLVSCSFAANSRDLTCKSGELSAKWQAPAEIKKVAVNDRVCIYASDDKIYCLKMALEYRLEFKEPAVEIASIPELTDLRSASLDNQFVVCAMSQAGTDCKIVLDAPLSALPIILAGVPPEQMISPLGLLMIDKGHKLMKISMNRNQITIEQAEGQARKYQSLAYSLTSACLVEKDSGELFCHRVSISGVDARLLEALPTPY